MQCHFTLYYFRLHHITIPRGLKGHDREWAIVVVQPHSRDKILCPWRTLALRIHRIGVAESHELEVVRQFPPGIAEGGWALQGNLSPLIHL